MHGGEHCILVHLEAPVDQASGFTAESLEAYKDSLHQYVWDALSPLFVNGGFSIPPERWVFEVDDPDGAVHATDVVFGGLDPGLFGRLFAKWRAIPLREALKSASKVPGDAPGFGAGEIEKAWADMSNIDLAFTPASQAEREAGFHDEDDLNSPDWAYDAYIARKQAQGYYDFQAGFFSLVHGSSKVSPEQVSEVEGHAENYALVFVPVKS